MLQYEMNLQAVLRNNCFWLCLSFLLIFYSSSAAAESSTNTSQKILQYYGVAGFYPYEYIENNKVSGFNIDLIRLIGEELNYNVRIEVMLWTNVVKKLKTGQGDFTMMSPSPERRKFFDFSNPVTLRFRTIFVRKHSDIRSFEDLAGKEVLIIRDGYAHLLLKEDARFTLILTSSFRETLKRLSDGEADAAVLSETGRMVLSDFPEVVSLGLPILSQKYCMAVKKGRGHLLKELNSGLERIQQSGQFEDIRKKWLVASNPKYLIYFKYVVVAVCVLLLCCLIAALWSWTLKKKVNQKTKELADELKERKKIEASLRRNRDQVKSLTDQLAAILEGITHRITYIDTNYHVIWDNSKKPLTLSSSDVADRCFRKFENRNSVCPDCPAVKSLQTGEPAEAVVTDLNNRSIEVKTFPLKNKDEAIVGIISMEVDVTEKMALQVDASMVSKMVSLGTIATGTAHDINNPNGVIQLYVPILKRVTQDLFTLIENEKILKDGCLFGGLSYEKASKGLPDMIKAIGESSERIKQIVQDLRDFTKQTESGISGTFILNDAVARALRLVSYRVKQSTSSFKIEYGDNIPAVC